MSAFAWRFRIMVVGLWMLLPLYAATAQETIKLRVADVLPSGHFVSTNGIKYFMDRVSNCSPWASENLKRRLR